MSDTNPAGWQPDPTGHHDHRYWDGTTWTDNVSDAGVAGTDPLIEAAGPEPVGASDAPTGDDPTTATPVPPADTTAAWSTTPGAPVPPLPQAVADGSNGSRGSKKGLLIGGGILAAVAVAVIAALALSGDDQDSTASRNAGSGDTEQTTTTEGAVTSDGGFSDSGTSVPANFEELYAGIFEQTFGLSRDKAECLAREVGNAIEAGDIREDEASSAFIDYLAACDIALDEIGAN